MKASTQWHDPGLFAVLISMPRSDIRFNRFICGGSLPRGSPARRGASCRHLLVVHAPETSGVRQATRFIAAPVPGLRCFSFQLPGFSAKEQL